MRTLALMLALPLISALVVATSEPAASQPNVLPLAGQTKTGGVEQIGWRNGYCARCYRPYGYYRPYRPWYGPRVGIWFGF